MPLNLTPAEHRLLGVAWQCFETQPKVNYKKLTELGGYKNTASANSCWCALKKKLANADVAGARDDSPKPKGKAGDGGRKRGATDAGFAQAETSKKRAKNVNRDGEGDEDDGESNVKVKVKEEERADAEEVDAGLLKGAMKFLGEDSDES